MTSTRETLARRIGLLIGAAVVANAGIEILLAVVVGNPLSPPLSSPQARFELIGSILPRLAEIVGGLGLLTLASWSGTKPRTQRMLGLAFLFLAAIAVLPLILLFLDFGERSIGLPAIGLVRARIQFVRILLFWMTLAGVLWTWGRALLARSRLEQPAASSMGMA